MTITTVLDIGSQSVILILSVAAPILLAALFVGLSVGVFQAVTQINEMTLTFIPKIIAVFGTIIFLLPWMAMKIMEYTINLFNRIPDFIR